MDELKHIAPGWSKMARENPFRTPPHYFDDFPARLQMKIEAEARVVPLQQNRMIRYLKPVMALAASFALIFMLVYVPMKKFSSNHFVHQTTGVELTEEEQYVSWVERMDENSFVAMLNEPVAAETFSAADLEVYINTNVTDYDIVKGTDF